jgi:hypothetical protein
MSVVDLRYQIPRAMAHTWVLVGRLGTPILPHVFAAARATWHLANKRMEMVEIELGVVETRPGGSVIQYAEQLRTMEQHIKEKKPTSLSTYADITRSVEAEQAVHKVVKECLVTEVVNTAGKAWSLPFFQIGRPLLLSKMQVVLSERKIASALTKDDDDPNRWSWERVRNALSLAALRPPRLSDEDILHDQNTDDDVALTIAQIVYNADTDIPRPYVIKERNVR